MKCPKNCASNYRLASAVFGVVSGISIFFTFGFQYKNWISAAWGLISGVWASFLLAVEVTNRVTQWERHKKCLIVFAILGFLGMALGITGFPVYITFAAIEKHHIMPYGRSFWIVSVWCFMTFKHSITLFSSSLRYYFRQTPEKEDTEFVT